MTIAAVCGALIAAASLPASALAAKAPPKPPPKPSTLVTSGTTYIALGDSIPFGYQEPGSGQNANVISSIVGYPEILAKTLHLKVLNLSCPGETSASIINSLAPNAGCTNQGGTGASDYRASFPLHVKYTGSQLSYAVNYLRTHKTVRLVSLQIGSSDLNLCQRTYPDGCANALELGAFDSQLSANVKTILSTIRTKAKYTGQLVVVNYYASDYSGSLETTTTINLDEVLGAAAAPFKVEFANTYTAFMPKPYAPTPCQSGLLDVIGPGLCGYHPTIPGQTLLAQTVQKAIKVGKPA